MRIIDAHAHISSWPTIRATRSLILRSMAKYGISHSLISNCDGAEFPSVGDPNPKMERTIEILKQTLSFHKAHKDRISAAMWIRPYYEQPDDELFNFLKRHRDEVRAMKFHPYEEHLRISSIKLQKWLNLAKILQMPVLVHTAADEYSAVPFIVKVAKAYPELSFVMAHLELCSDNKRAIRAMKKHNNLYADTAWVPLESTLRVLREVGIDRIMFGTDNPIDGLDTLANPMYRAYFAPDCPLTQDEKEHLFHLNAERIYGI